jgi:signal transduction histidine kinase
MVQSMAYQCQERQIFVDIDVPPTIIEGDEVLLYEVWMNLFANAIRHSPMEASIFIRLELRSTEVVVTIQDEGPGLSPEVLPFIFERFYRADKARSRSYESNGLGLSIAQKIVERHHGFISASSTEDQGATFTVVLPYTPFDS